MSTADFQARDSHVRNRTKRRRRLGFSLDMTPLVDVAFLLLTFFMFATTMAQPQTLEVPLPAGMIDAVVDVHDMNIDVLRDGRLLWRMGNEGALKPASRAAAIDLITAHYRTAGSVVRLKVDTAARYQRLIDLLDDIRRAGRRAAAEPGAMHDDPKTRFSVQRMAPHDYEEAKAP